MRDLGCLPVDTGESAPRIQVLSGPVRTGKTTCLMGWARERADVDGLLSPDIGGVRWWYHLGTSAYFPFEVAPGTPAETEIAIGRFIFYRESFARAQQILLAALAIRPAWLVVDEVGKLELGGEGLEPALGRVIDQYRESEGAGRLILVVRDSLLAAAVARYRLTGKIHLIGEGSQKR